MSVQVQCPNPACGKTAAVPEHFRGHAIRCRSCRHKFKVPVDTRETRLEDRTAGAGVSATVGGFNPATPTDTPALIGRFEVRTRLGAGAFGAVYRAFDPHLQREVALKVPHPGTLNDPRVRERFLREAKAAAGLRHPHIVPVYDAGCEDGLHYIAAAFIEGRTLEDARRLQPHDFRLAAQTVRQLAEALAYAHRLGIVHRDVKPANVLVDPQGSAHLTDFGLAHRQEGADKLTQDGTVLGTPAYMAPEQAQGHSGEPQPASDQYSLGVVLYELLCGQTPFSGPPPIVLFNAIHQEPPPPHRVNPQVPRDLETVCLKAMAKQPSERYRDCQELADDLRRWLEGEPIRARQCGTMERLVRWCRREPRLAALGAVLIVCLLTVAVVATRSALRLRDSKQRIAADRTLAEERAKAAGKHAEVAQDQARQAATEAETARQARNEAAQRAREAQNANAQANADADKARQARAEAEKRERAGRLQLYEAHLNLARQAVNQKDKKRAWEWLQRPAQAQSDLRGADWYALSYTHGLATLLEGHISEVRSVAFSPDGKTLASGSLTGTVALGDVATGQRRSPFPAHTNAVTAVVFSPDGQTLATAGLDQTVKLWDLAGKERLSLKAESGVTSLAFTPDGKTVAGGIADGVVDLWDAVTGKKRTTLRGHQGRITSVAISPDGKTLASGSEDNTVKLWDVATGQEWRTLTGHEGVVRAVAFSADGNTLASGGEDGNKPELKLWDTRTGTEQATLKGHARSVRSVAFSPDGKTLASGSEDATVKLWDTLTSQERATLKGHTNGVFTVAFSSDGRRLATGSDDHTVRVWDVPAGKDAEDLWRGLAAEQEKARRWNATVAQERAPVEQSTQLATCLAVRSDGKFLAADSPNDTVAVIDAVTGEVRMRLKEHVNAVTSVAFAPDGMTLASGSRDQSIKLWDLATGKVKTSLSGHTDGIGCVAFDPQGKVVASGSYDNTVKLWDAAAGEILRTLKGHSSFVTVLAFSPVGKVLASGSADQTVRLWDVATGRELFTLKGHTDPVSALAFRADGQVLASASMDNTVRLWSIVTGQQILQLKGKPAGVRCLAFAPDGATLATGNQAGTVTLWDTITGAERYSLPGDGASLLTLSFSADGQTLVGGSGQRSLRQWNVRATGLTDLFTLKGHSEKVNSVVFGAGGKMLASRSSDGTVKLWEVTTGKERASTRGNGGATWCMVFSPDSKTLATALGNDVKLWDVGTGRERRTLPHPSAIACASFLADRNTLVTWRKEGKINAETSELKRWDARTGKEHRTVKGDARGVVTAQFSPDGKTLALGCRGTFGINTGSVRLLDANSGGERAVLREGVSSYPGVVFSPDGTVLVTVGAAHGLGGGVKLWDAATGKERSRLSVSGDSRMQNEAIHAGLPYPGIAFTSDVRVVATVSGHEVKLWDGLGRSLPDLKPPPNQRSNPFGVRERVTCLVFSPDGKTLATGNMDGTVELWDVATGRLRDTLRGHSKAVYCLAFTPDGKILASGSIDTTVKVWGNGQDLANLSKR
jgi:WD40 repeat protein